MPDSTATDSLTAFAGHFDRASLQPDFQKAEAERLLIAERYPLSRLADLTLKDYATGDGENYADTLTGLLARGTPALGNIGGVGWNQTGIFKLKGTGLYKSHLKQTGDAAQDWIKLRAALVECNQLAGHGKWFEIDKIALARWIPAVRTKLLYVYWPKEVLPIYNSKHMGQYLKAFGTGDKPRSGAYSATPNRQLLDFLRSLPTLKDWHPWELLRLLKAWSPLGDTSAEKSEALPTTMPSHSLNGIFYGPPGTGKTWQVIRTAAAFVTGYELPPDEAKRLYDQLVQEGRIRFATFHQSFSYEDFMEGIRPVMHENGSASFEVRDGVLKEIAIRALFDCLELTGSDRPTPNNGKSAPGTNNSNITQEPPKPDFDSYWQVFETAINQKNGKLSIEGLGSVNWTLQREGNGKFRAISSTIPGNPYWLDKECMMKIWKKWHPKTNISIEEAKQAQGSKTCIRCRTSLYNYLQKLSPVVPSISQNSELPDNSAGYVPAEVDSAHPDEYRDFDDSDPKEVVQKYLSEGPASGWQLRADGQFPGYVIVIDEINRGNISRIFGELITLIEPDKRHGRENSLSVILPCSQQPFTVPPNLYLLGTMNTADKSLALHDIALRRRFDFEELAPDFGNCSDLTETMRKILIELNDRLERRKDRDHRIGHAFFMAVSDVPGFNEVFRRKVVPLLQEYFFNDIDGARYVLGEADQTNAAGFLRKLSGNSKWQRTHWRWFTDEEPGMDCYQRLAVNYATPDES